MKNEPYVCDLLRNGMTYAELYEKHGIKACPFNGKVSLAYDQIDARESDVVSQQCRGLVLREGSFEILARPFDRFFNLGQGAAADIDWDTTEFEEKHDGTLLIVYNDYRKWCAATRQSCEAQGEVMDGMTFARLADMAARNHGWRSIHDMMDDRLIEFTWMFELTAPHNRILVAYEQPTLTLLGVRNRYTGEELDPRGLCGSLGVPTPKVYSVNSAADMQEFMRDWKPTEHEGVVAKDAQFRRVKIKTPAYVAAHKLCDTVGKSWRRVAELVISGGADDVLPTVPEFMQERIVQMQEAVRKLTEDVAADLERINHLEEMKAFALEAQKTRWPGALFAVRRGKAASVSEFVRRAQPKTIVRLAGFDDDEENGD